MVEVVVVVAIVSNSVTVVVVVIAIVWVVKSVSSCFREGSIPKESTSKGCCYGG